MLESSFVVLLGCENCRYAKAKKAAQQSDTTEADNVDIAVKAEGSEQNATDPRKAAIAAAIARAKAKQQTQPAQDATADNSAEPVGEVASPPPAAESDPRKAAVAAALARAKAKKAQDSAKGNEQTEQVTSAQPAEPDEAGKSITAASEPTDKDTDPRKAAIAAAIARAKARKQADSEKS